MKTSTKLLCAILLACFFAACAGNVRKPKPNKPAAVKNSYDYRLLYTASPYSDHDPQVLSLPDGAADRLASVWEKAHELEPAEVSASRRHHSPSSYILEGSDGGEWQFLSLVDRDGELLKVGQRDEPGEVSWLTDEDVSKLLRKQIRAMEQERGNTGEEKPKSSHVSAPPKPQEIIVIKPGFVKSPYDPAGRPVDIRGVPSGVEVEDPYVPGKTFFVP